MSKYACINGQFVKSDEPQLLVSNRSFQYGDGVFETIRCLNSQPLFFEKHFQRLQNALHQLNMILPDEYSENYFIFLIQNLLQKNRIYKGARARLHVFRNEGGYYTPSDNSASFLLTVDAIDSEYFMLNEKGIHIDIYTNITKPINELSQFKTCNALLFVKAGLWKKEQSLDDCLLLNNDGNIIESSASNFFMVTSGKLVTPSIYSGCVDGTMRRTIFEIAAEKNIQLMESDKIQEKHLATADEIFLTNAIQGISWVGAFKNHRYYHNFSSKLTAYLNETIKAR
jgi:branched-subunit amino acid aminotransferase/4-amino-4-deoxychorismate lyase